MVDSLRFEPLKLNWCERQNYATAPMRVHVLLFGMLRDLAGKPLDTLDVREGASVRDVLAHYEAHFPHLRAVLPSLAVAVNQCYAGPEMQLKADDEVALLPPVSGGTPKSEPGCSHVSIVRDRIDADRVLSKLKRGEDGAAVVFEGVVRNQTRGRRTLYLEYEAYEPMALTEMEKLATESLGKSQIRDVSIVHRLGRLEIGETSVLIVVVSAHRGPAFDVCRWIIDTLKRTVPIWKKEYFEDGAVWADGEPFPVEIPRANS